nr:nuclear transport factor 2 family protein [Streptomyces spiramenti]
MWERMQRREWDGVAELLAEDVTVEWPVSREVFAGRENFVGVNREYPEGWSIRVLRVVAETGQVVSEVEVEQEGVGTFRAVSFWTVRGGVIAEGREYWTFPGSDPAPEWREKFRGR